MGVTGSVAAYRAPEVVRRLMGRGVEVEVVLTRGARRFVGAALFGGITGRPVLESLWDDPMAHIQAERRADLVLVCPATAHLIARASLGLADDLLTSLLLGAEGPVLMAPAMNRAMWEHPATKGHVETLAARGVGIVDPEAGELACGEEGLGRLAPVDEVVWQVMRRLTAPDLGGRRILVTAGPTREPLDAVRHLSNPASGRMGAALAAACWERGAEGVLVAGPGTPPSPAAVHRHDVGTAREMDEVVAASEFDMGFFAAAVSDWTVADPPSGKPGKSEAPIGSREWALSPDVLRRARERSVDATVVGFAAVASDDLAAGAAKVVAKGADAVVVNDVTRPGAGFASPTNEGALFMGERELPLGPADKGRFAHEIIDRLLEVDA